MEKRIKEYYFNSTKEILKSYRELKIHKDILLIRLEEIQEYKKRNVKAVKFDEIKVQSSSVGDKIGSQVVKFIEMEEMTNDEIKRINTKLKKIEKAISTLSDEELEIINLNIFERISPDKVSEMIGFDRSQIFRKRKEALRKVAICLYGEICIE